MEILFNMGSNIFKGEISYITMAVAAVLQLGVTMDYSIFLWHSFKEHKAMGSESKPAMAEAINKTLTSIAGSSTTTIAGFLALCFMTFTLGLDLGIVMAKGVIFGIVYYKTGSLKLTMLMHFTNNFLSLVLSNIDALKDVESWAEVLPAPSYWALVALSVLVAAVVIVCFSRIPASPTGGLEKRKALIEQ